MPLWRAVLRLGVQHAIEARHAAAAPVMLIDDIIRLDIYATVPLPCSAEHSEGGVNASSMDLTAVGSHCYLGMRHWHLPWP